MSMEFCASCGILLFSPKNSGYCNPCLEISLSLQTSGKECSCDFCTHFCNQSPTTLQVEIQDKPKRVKKNLIQREKPKKDDSALPTARIERKKNSKQRLTEECKVASHIDDSWTAIPSDDWNLIKVKDYRTVSEVDWSSPLDNPWMSYQANDWVTENDTSTAFGNDIIAKMDSYQQQQYSGKEPMENYVPEDIRKQWKSDQKEYKRQLIKHDTTDIIQLASGKRKKDNGKPFYIGGVDISFIKDNNVDACACLTVVQMPDLTLVYKRIEMIELTQPYIPGYLAFREVPALEDLYRKLESAAPEFLPDVIMVDGNGILHPRECGLACQLGVILNVPTIGVAKTLISAQGVMDDESHKAKKQTLSQAGDSFELVSDSGTVLGLCLRTHDLAPNPMYISIGHKISLESATWITLECSKYRIPEPVRRADLYSREYLREELTEPIEFVHKEYCE